MLQKYNALNNHILIFVKDKLYARDEAKVSVFDSTVQGGDAVWEGLRVYNGKVMCLSHHLNRLFESAKTLAFANVPDEKFIRNAIKETIDANKMHNDAHIRLTLSRGEKYTSGMDPRLNDKGCCLIVLAEHKKLVYDQLKGMSVISTSIRRNNPQFLDSKIHHNNLLNNILAKIQANVYGADAALMLDERGFASELNDTNIFVIKNNKVFTPFASNCLPGITRKTVMDLCFSLDIEVMEKDISLSELYNADFMFSSGTMGELTPIVEIDGRYLPIHNELYTTILSQFKERIPLLCENII